MLRRSSRPDPAAKGSLQLDACSRSFTGAGGEKIRALDDVTLHAGAGEVVAIVGSNGAGKSTMLSLIAGSALVDNGRVLIDGVDQTLQPSWKRARYVQRVRQNPADNVIGSLTIEENFALVVPDPYRFWLKRTRRGPLRERAVAALRPFEMGLENRLHTFADELSGGQRQAVAVAMATVAQPSVLLLDEHTAALDPRSARLVLEVTDRLVRDASITTLMVTHDMSRALQHADRLLMMHRGQIVTDISGEEMKNLEPRDLIDMFERQSGDVVSDRTALA